MIVFQNWDDIFDDDFDELLTKPAEYWTGLMRTAFSGPRVRVKGIPSEEYRWENRIVVFFKKIKKLLNILKHTFSKIQF